MLNNGAKRRYAVVYIFIIIIVVGVTSTLLKLINEHNQEEKGFLIERSYTHFKDIVNSRAWNAKFGGVYVYKKDDIEPNPYLKNNHIYDKDGALLVKINPAWMTRMLSEIKKDDEYDFRITSLNPINPVNKPDKFENRGLTYLEENPEENYYSELNRVNSELKFIGKLPVTDACMKCHAEQGYKVGDIRGGISVTLDAKNYYELFDFMKNVEVFVILVAIMILIISYFMLLYIYRNEKSVKNRNLDLEEKIKQRTKDLEAAKLKAETANRLKSEFLSNVTHEIKTPLNTILSMSKLALEECNTQELDCLTSINNAGKHLNSFVNNIIDYSKLEAGILKPNIQSFNIKGLMNIVKKRIYDKAVTKGVELELVIDKDIPSMLNGDFDRVHRVLHQLSDNAVKFSKSGEKVILSVKMISQDKQKALLSFSVVDNGIGITDEEQKSLFMDIRQLDQSLSRKYSGIGMGLAFCKKLVDLLDGNISIQSKLDQGTTVIVELSFTIGQTQKPGIVQNLDDEIQIDEIQMDEIQMDEAKVVSNEKVPKECIELLDILRIELSTDYSKSLDTLTKVKDMTKDTIIEEKVILMEKKIRLFDVDAATDMIGALIDEIVAKDEHE